MQSGTKYFMGLEGFIWWIGVVEDRQDPEQLGRVRVRCFGWHTDEKDKIPTDCAKGGNRGCKSWLELAAYNFAKTNLCKCTKGNYSKAKY